LAQKSRDEYKADVTVNITAALTINRSGGSVDQDMELYSTAIVISAQTVIEWLQNDGRDLRNSYNIYELNKTAVS
jgi:hypothetical protein